MIDNTRETVAVTSAHLASYASRHLGAQTKVCLHTAPTTDGETEEVPWHGAELIAMLMYPGMTALDLIGPHNFLGRLLGAKILLVAESLEPVTSDAGVTIAPTATFETCPKELTILFTPGGNDGTLAAASNRATLGFMADRGARAQYVTSVCTGSLILGAAGLLNGYRATSHWSVRHVLSRFGAIPTEARVERDRNRITGAGVTAGLDFGLTLVAELRGSIYAECTQLVSEYDPRPPFSAGSPKTAPKEVTVRVSESLAGFVNKAEALVSLR